MKTLVFSDLHLGKRFEIQKYEFLKKLISGADRVIINGDFWDGYLTTFDAFIKSPWNKLFPLLKGKKAVYIYGNHDRMSFSDARRNLFSIKQSVKHTLVDSGNIFIFEHGNRILPSIDDRFTFSKKTLYRSTMLFTRTERVITRSIRGTARVWGFLLNNYLKKNTKPANGAFFIFGHTHFAEFDPAHKFAVLGFIQHGLAQYAVIENGKISAKQQWYE